MSWRGLSRPFAVVKALSDIEPSAELAATAALT